jgi:hypothetical protein
MNRDALKRELTQHFNQSLEEAMDAVERAPDGAWIADSEWQVRETFQKLMTEAYQRILQARLDDAAGAAPAAFSPCGPPEPGQAPGKQRPPSAGRAQRRR